MPTAKKNRQQEEAKRDASDRNISEYFTSGAGKTQPKPKVSLAHSGVASCADK